MKFVYIGEDLSAIGFRKMAALYPRAEKIFIPIRKSRRIDLDKVASHLIDDVVGFSFMTSGAQLASGICERIRRIGKVYIIWGGVHATLFPEESLRWADAVCVGEGELSAASWKDGINRGKFLTNADLDAQPFAYNDFDCTIYDNGFKPLTEGHYLRYSGSLYRTLWVRGCPHQCSYCANSSLVSIDEAYRTLRHPSVDYVISEITLALSRYKFATTVCFDDDNFISLPLSTIEEFCTQWKARVGKPFVVMGMHPGAVTEAKVRPLAGAGMNRVRMGIQSGDPAVLEIYNRKTQVGRIRASAEVLARAARDHRMVPPNYDIISDFMDSEATLDFVRSLPRPYTLAVFSLRIMPRTALAAAYPEEARSRRLDYLNTRPTWHNVTLYLLSICGIPECAYRYLRSKRGAVWPAFHALVRALFMLKKQWDHVRRGDLSKIKGRLAVAIWAFRKVVRSWR